MSQFTSEAGTSKGCYEDTQMIKLHMRTGRPLSGTDFVEHLELLLERYFPQGAQDERERRRWK
jgi:hypothetical protein